MYVCMCEGVTDKQIQAAIERGADSMRALRNTLGITRQCGECGRCTKAILSQRSPCPPDSPSGAIADYFALSFKPVLAID